MPRNQPSNRIQVDLKLLQDKNAEKLIAFGNSFATSVETLKVALGDYAEQLAGAGGLTGQVRSGRSSAASVAGNVAEEMQSPSARTGGTTPHPTGQTVGEVRGSASTGGSGSGGGPLPPPGQNVGGYDVPDHSSRAPAGAGGDEPDSLEQQFVKAQKRIGEIPVGLRQTLGYAAEGQLNLKNFAPGTYLGSRESRGDPAELKVNPETGQYAMGTPQLLARRASEAMFTGQALKANVMNMHRSMTGHFGAMNAAMNAGQDLGYSRESSLFGFMSPAYRESLKSNLKSMWSSKFGFNPNYSGDQARQARATLAQYGYGGDQADTLAETLKQFEIHNRMTPETTMKMLDPMIRFGGTEMSQFTDTISGFGEAAKSANMNLSDFTEKVVSLASQLAENGPGSTTGYAAQLSAFSAVTGMSPEKGAAMLQDRTQTFMAMAQTGQSYAKATIGPNALGARLKAPMSIGNQLVKSYGFKDMGELNQAYVDMTKGRPVSKKAEDALSSLQMMIDSNPELFGGMNLKQLMSNSVRGNVLGKTEALADLSMLGDTASENDFQGVIKKFGGGDKMREGLADARSDIVKKLDKKGTKGEERQHAIAQAEKKYLMSAMGKTNEKQSHKNTKQTIGLSAEAKKWFKINVDSDKDHSASNQFHGAQHYAQEAISGVEDAFGFARDHGILP
jgi:hypothetical protein